jgi:hypothetical protein
MVLESLTRNTTLFGDRKQTTILQTNYNLVFVVLGYLFSLFFEFQD